jgi:diacylglycerol kinase family enzyme
VAVGGDGTLSEVTNGMLLRSDKKRLPIGILPNGTGNDFLRNLETFTLEKALNNLVKGDLMSVDIYKVFIDHENENDVI